MFHACPTCLSIILFSGPKCDHMMMVEKEGRQGRLAKYEAAFLKEQLTDVRTQMSYNERTDEKYVLRFLILRFNFKYNSN